MKRILKRTIALLLLSILIVTLVGCKKEVEKTNNQGGNGAKGRYIEEDGSFPMDLGNGFNIYAFERLEDDSLRIISSNKDTPIEVYASNDGGNTWEKVSIDASVIPEGKRIDNAAIDKKGNMFISYGAPLDPNDLSLALLSGKILYEKIDVDGNVTPLEIILPGSEESEDGWYNTLIALKIANNGDIFGIDDSGSVYQIDPTTGKNKNIYSSNQYIYDYVLLDNKLVVAMDDGVEQYDITTGNQLENLEILSEYLLSDSSEVSLMTAGSKENELYFSNQKGLFRYILGGTLVEQMVDGSLNSMSAADAYMLQLVEKPDGSFFILYQNFQGEFHLMTYSYDENISAVPDNEITVYSLEDSSTVRQAIALFHKANPDVHVIFEVGISGDDAITMSDALKKLNIEIMAGKGPDIFILNDIRVDSYIDKGLLEDMSSILGEYEEQGALFEKITSAYKVDGKIYAAPIRFMMPMINAKQEVLNQISNIETLTDYIVKLKNQGLDKGLILDFYKTSEILLSKLYPVELGNCFEVDGSVDGGKLTNFFNKSKEIYQACMQFETQDELEKHIEADLYRFKHLESINDRAAFNAYQLPIGEVQLNIGNISSLYDIAHLADVTRKDDSFSYQRLYKDKALFIPSITIGMSSSAGDKETSKRFINYLFGEEAQSIDLYEGLPVNRVAFEMGEEEKDLTHYQGILSEADRIIWPKAEELHYFKQMVEQLDTPTFENILVIEALLEVWDPCLTGNITVDEAVESLMKKINIYLAEQQ